MKGIMRKIRDKLVIFKYKRYGVNIGENCCIHKTIIDKGHGYLITIGDNCTLTKCIILSHDASTKRYIGKTKIGRVIIGNNCFIGMSSIILPGVKIGDNSIIGCGSVVCKDIPAGSVAIGNPARVIMSTEDFINKHKIKMKELPVFKKSWSKKTKEEKIYERDIIEQTNMGYDA